MGINGFGDMTSMRNTLIRETLIFTIMIIAVLFASTTLAKRAGVNVFEVVSSILDSDVEDTKSIVWFINHPSDRQQQIKACDKYSHLSVSRNCVNADSAEQISRQINLHTYPVNQHEYVDADV
jgi:hypothetical protein